MKEKKIAKYGIVNDVLHEWYIKCCQAGIYPDRAMLQGQALKIKTDRNDSKLKRVKAVRNQKRDLLWHFLCPRCFRKLPNPSKPYGMQYFHSKKAWMTTEIKIQVLTALDRKLDVENRKDSLFLDNVPFHPKTLQGNLKNIKLVFLSKIPLLSYSLVSLVSSGILRLSIASIF